MTDTFTASNGIQITMDTDRDGKVYLVGHRARGDEGQYLDTHATGGPEGIVALREFFQHERDKELGRWRCPTETDWVAREGVRTADGRTVAVVNERTLDRFWFNERVRDAEADVDVAHRVGRAYFEAHPERKPWHDAEHGEIWVLTIDGSEQVVSAVQQYEKDFNPISHPLYATFANGSEHITDARRIWPEDAS